MTLHPAIASLLSGLVAQAAKVAWEALTRRRWRPMLFFHNGGMPSSHASTVTTLTLLTARNAGLGSSVFSLVLVFSLFVIFEATGLRQEIGKQARVLNEMVEQAVAGKPVAGRRLRELVGHTWTEVLGGVVVGILVYLWLGPQVPRWTGTG